MISCIKRLVHTIIAAIEILIAVMMPASTAVKRVFAFKTKLIPRIGVRASSLLHIRHHVVMIFGSLATIRTQTVVNPNSRQSYHQRRTWKGHVLIRRQNDLLLMY
jgi:hypothetical protein